MSTESILLLSVQITISGGELRCVEERQAQQSSSNWRWGGVEEYTNLTPDQSGHRAGGHTM